ncbi:MAG: hypothetical protein ACLRWQ_12830 [Flavonifractor plautii]
MTGSRWFVSTASPFKFCDSVLRTAWALLSVAGLPRPGSVWRRSPETGVPSCPPGQPPKDKAVRFEESVDKEKMMDVVLDMLR